jgi:hypothetical protein
MSANSSSGADSAIVLRGTSYWGPFAKGEVALAPAQALVSNAADRPLIVTSARVGPIANARTGLAAAGSLVAKVASGPLQPGDSALLTISGSAPARPGSYRAQLDLQGAGGTQISTPLRVDVAASALWGILCLLLGLSLIGVIRLLSGQGDVEELARSTIRERSAIRAEWDRNPPPASHAAAVAEIERSFDDALRSRSEPRGYWVVDRRISDANIYLTAAREAEAKLRGVATDTPGALETAELEREWEALKTLATAPGARPPEGEQVGQDLAAHVREIMEGARARIVSTPAKVYVAGLEPHVERVKLALAAGEEERSREMALSVRRWMLRAADDLEKRQALMIGLTTIGGNLLALDARLRQLALDETIAADARAKWIASVDAANAKLASGLTLENFRKP